MADVSNARLQGPTANGFGLNCIFAQPIHKVM